MKSKLKRSKYQSGGNLNPLDPNSYGKKYRAIELKQPASKYSLTVTPSTGSTKTAPGAREQYLGAGKPAIKSGDVLTDFVYGNAELLDNPITRPILQDQMYKYMKGSEANPSVKTAEPLKGKYTGASPEESGNYDLVAQYVYGNQNMPKAKYAPKSDYLEFLPTYSIKKPGKNYGNVLEEVQGNFWLSRMLVEGPDSENFIGLEEAKQLVKEKIKKKEPIYTTGENQMTENNYAFGYDLGSYKSGIQYDEKGRPYVGISDAWDFEPSTYKDKWSSSVDSQGVKRTYQQAYLAHKFGNPFKIYDRFYFDPETGQHIPDPDANGKYQTGGDIVSKLGYRDDSPFKNAPQLTINSPSISMENVSIPLLGISRQTGETKLMKPNKKYKFKNTSSVTEVPAYQKGGALDSILGAVQGAGAFLGPAGAIASGVATLVPLVKDLFSGPDKTVVSASPGKYADGGEIHINPKNKGKFTAAAKRAGHSVQEHARAVLADPNATPLQKKRANFARNAAKWNHQMGGNLIDTSLFVMPQSNTMVAPHPLQQLQAPQDITSPIVPGMPAPAMQSTMPIQFKLDHAGFEGSNKVKSKDRFREKQMGGDLALSNDAFQVQGNPNVVDGNSYPTLNANLDHKEVVSNTQDGNKFVFSTDLKDPQTGKPFSELAAKQERAKGKAEKILKTHPYDEQAKSTISMSNANLNHISNVQEAIATALGHRNVDGSTRQQYQTGGRLNYQTAGTLQPPKATDFVWDPVQNKYVSRTSEVADLRGMIMSPIDSFIGAPATTSPQIVTPIIAPSTGPLTTGLVSDARKDTGKVGVKKITPKKTTPNWLTAGRAYNVANPDPYAEQAVATEAAGGLRATPFNPTMDQRAAMADPNFAARQTFYNEEGDTPLQTGLTADRVPATLPLEEVKYETPWTLGDTFKGIELLSKGIGAFGRAEKERPLLDNTQITQEVYDPTANLAQTRRSYSNYVNAIGAAAPINLRRGLASSALSNRYAQDNQTLAQFNALNQGARSQYQQRVGAQRQFNVQSQFRTNEINAANRAAKDAVQQNFFTSIGQFGEDLNRKRYASDIINLYRNQAPDVFESYIKDLMK